MDSKLRLFSLSSHFRLNLAQFLLQPLVLFPQLFVEVSRLILTRVDTTRLSSYNPILVLIIVGRKGSLALLVLISVRGRGLDVWVPKLV